MSKGKNTEKKLSMILKEIDTDTPEIFYSKIDKVLNEGEKRFVITANPEIIMMAIKNPEFEKIVGRTDTVVIPDGIGVVKGISLLLEKKDVKRNTGVEFVQHLLEYADECKKRVFIYGSKQEVLDSFIEKCRQEYPNIVFVGALNGYTNDETYVLSEITKAVADVYLVALGTPRQELFIEKFYSNIRKGICVGIGGSLDVLSGQVKRAPEFFLNNNLEWLYRIAKEPKRIKRFIKGNIKFLCLVMRERYFGK